MKRPVIKQDWSAMLEPRRPTPRPTNRDFEDAPAPLPPQAEAPLPSFQEMAAGPTHPSPVAADETQPTTSALAVPSPSAAAAPAPGPDIRSEVPTASGRPSR